MSVLKQITVELNGSDNWTGHTYGELKEALLNLCVLTLNLPEDEAASVEKTCEELCESHIDYLLYTQMDLTAWVGGHSDPTFSWEEWLKDNWDLPLGKESKRNLFVFYLNTYFSKYITAELQDIHDWLADAPSAPIRETIDRYITALLYPFDVGRISDPSLTYENMQEVPDSRKQNLREVSEKLSQALLDNDMHLQFESVFLLMTWFVGSAYRRVHAAVTTLLNVDMAEFRELFFQNIDTIIENKGGLNLTGFVVGS